MEKTIEKEVKVKKEVKKEVKEEVKSSVISDEDYNAMHNISLRISEASLKIGYIETEKFNMILEHNKFKQMKDQLVSKINKDQNLVEGSQWTIDPDTKEIQLIET